MSEGKMLEISVDQIASWTAMRTVKFWGQDCKLEPVFITPHMGDGEQLIAITPLNTRPNYYLIRVDSRWWSDSFEWQPTDGRQEENHIAEHIDEICEVIEEEVGGRYCEDDDGNEVLAEWPALNDEAGVSWSSAKDLLQKSKRGENRK